MIITTYTYIWSETKSQKDMVQDVFTNFKVLF